MSFNPIGQRPLQPSITGSGGAETKSVEGFQHTPSTTFNDLPAAGNSVQTPLPEPKFKTLADRDKEEMEVINAIYDSHHVSYSGVMQSLKEAGLEGMTQQELQRFDTNTVGGTAVVSRMAGELLQIRPGDHIVDIGAGIGGPVRTMLDQHPGTTAIGIEPHGPRVQAANALNERVGLADRVKMLEGFSHQFDVKGSVVTSFDTVAHIGTPAECVAELVKHGQPNARVGVTCQCVSPNLTKEEQEKFDYVKNAWGGHLYTRDDWSKAIALVSRDPPKFVPTDGTSAHFAHEIADAKSKGLADDHREVRSRKYAKELVDAGKFECVSIAFEANLASSKL